jgi:hypothetical protein
MRAVFARPRDLQAMKHQEQKFFCFFFSKKKNLLLSYEKDAKRLLFLAAFSDGQAGWTVACGKDA